ncbi:hypothetical protein VTL71DRAFT_7784 [Oculimacula yallundae]|uniref:Uncharacterized protein n=1 Tax=Oculimacula yallundae TaxID=86028 RepID=A0ABR4CVN8_9HELO
MYVDPTFPRSRAEQYTCLDGRETRELWDDYSPLSSPLYEGLGPPNLHFLLSNTILFALRLFSVQRTFLHSFFATPLICDHPSSALFATNLVSTTIRTPVLQLSVSTTPTHNHRSSTLAPK